MLRIQLTREVENRWPSSAPQSQEVPARAMTQAKGQHLGEGRSEGEGISPFWVRMFRELKDSKNTTSLTSSPAPEQMNSWNSFHFASGDTP